MDLLRSCYTTLMDIGEDTSIVCPVKWFFTQPEAPPFPFYHRFGSGNWASDKIGWTGPGEIEGAPRPWSNGRSIPHLVGQKFCGDPEQFRFGAKFTDRKICTDDEGVSSCCLEPREWWCCDYQQLGLNELPFEVVEERIPPPPYPTPWVMPTYDPILLRDVPDQFSFHFDFHWPPLWDPQSLGVRFQCGNNHLQLGPAFQIGGERLAELETGDPMGALILKYRPFPFSLIYPYNFIEWDVVVGERPHAPPPPDFKDIFPIDYFPHDYFPPTVL